MDLRSNTKKLSEREVSNDLEEMDDVDNDLVEDDQPAKPKKKRNRKKKPKKKVSASSPDDTQGTGLSASSMSDLPAEVRDQNNDAMHGIESSVPSSGPTFHTHGNSASGEAARLPASSNTDNNSKSPSNSENTDEQPQSRSSSDISDAMIESCANCHAAKKKCDRVRPACDRCVKTGRSCVYPAGATDPHANSPDPEEMAVDSEAENNTSLDEGMTGGDVQVNQGPVLMQPRGFQNLTQLGPNFVVDGVAVQQPVGSSRQPVASPRGTVGPARQSLAASPADQNRDDAFSLQTMLKKANENRKQVPPVQPSPVAGNPRQRYETNTTSAFKPGVDGDNLYLPQMPDPDFEEFKSFSGRINKGLENDRKESAKATAAVRASDSARAAASSRAPTSSRRGSSRGSSRPFGSSRVSQPQERLPALFGEEPISHDRNGKPIYLSGYDVDDFGMVHGENCPCDLCN